MNKRDFDKQAATYDQPHAIERAESIVAAIRRQINLTSDMDVMDYGAGTGLVTLEIAPYVGSVTAVDSSKGMLAVLEGKAEAQGITNVRTLFCDFEEEGLPDLESDLVIAAMTLHHIRDTQPFLRSLYGMLRPNGILAIADLDTEAGDFHADLTGIHHLGFDRDDLKRHFEGAGFRQVETSTAHVMSKETAGGEIKDFPIFLMTGRKQ